MSTSHRETSTDSFSPISLENKEQDTEIPPCTVLPDLNPNLPNWQTSDPILSELPAPHIPLKVPVLKPEPIMLIIQLGEPQDPIYDPILSHYYSSSESE